MKQLFNKTTLPSAITIDGPAASGKTTIGRKLAAAIGYVMLDTGIMYRAVTVGALIAAIDPADEVAVTRYAEKIDIAIESPAGCTDDRSYTVLVGGIDLTWQLRSELADRYVSQVAAWAGVRREMVARQRKIGLAGQVVMVGRDIGTVVLPQAALKLYIVASAAERAARRFAENEQHGDHTSYQHILAEIKRRDAFDSSRTHSPLRPADDAHIIDSTAKTPDQILQEIFALL